MFLLLLSSLDRLIKFVIKSGEYRTQCRKLVIKSGEYRKQCRKLVIKSGEYRTQCRKLVIKSGEYRHNGDVQISLHKINNTLLSYLSNYSCLVFFNVFFVFTMIIYLSSYSRFVVILTNPDKFNGVMMRNLLVFVNSLSVSMT